MTRDELRDAIVKPATAAGLRLPDSNAEIVIQTERPELETNLTVASADAAASAIVRATSVGSGSRLSRRRRSRGR